ncbi:hypothetical protein H9P43_004470 [Blastocladiella emersonii ATCC 22665]|nr:hypothetical protein H9P43_004470 [Blastocladiella emersonii ATCC 22665]
MSRNPHWTTDSIGVLLGRTKAEWNPLEFATRIEDAVPLLYLNLVQAVIGTLTGGLFLFVAFKSRWFNANPANVLSTLLGISSFVYAATTLVTKAVLIADQQWSFTHCILDGSIHSFMLTSYLIVLFFASMERYMAIVVMKKMTIRFAWFAGGLSWAIGAANTAIHWAVAPNPVISNSGLYCCPGFDSSGYIFALSIVAINLIIINVVAIIVAYGGIIVTLRSNFRRLKSVRAHNGPAEKQVKLPRFRDMFRSSSSRGIPWTESEASSGPHSNGGSSDTSPTSTITAPPSPRALLPAAAPSAVVPSPANSSKKKVATKDKDELALLRTEALLLRRGILTFAPFSMTWVFFIALLVHSTGTGTRVPSWMDQVLNFWMCAGTAFDPLIILAVDKQYRSKAARLLPWLDFTAKSASKPGI